MNKKFYLENLLSEKLKHKCIVWYENHRKGGWFFKSDKLVTQRLGFNYKQALRFIEEYDWTWIVNSK